MKGRFCIGSLLAFLAFCQSFELFRSFRMRHNSDPMVRLVNRQINDDSDFQLHESISARIRRHSPKGAVLSSLTGLLIFCSAMHPAMSATLGTKVDIGESVSCENIQLDHLVKVGAGGGGTVFSAIRRDPSTKITAIDDSVIPKVVVKVSWATSANSVRHECEVLRYLEKYNVRGVERCIASGVYSPPTAKTLPPTAVAAIQKHDGIVFFLEDKSVNTGLTATDAFREPIVAATIPETPRKMTSYIVSLYEEDKEQKMHQQKLAVEAQKVADTDRVMIVLDPFFRATRPAKSTLQDIEAKAVKVTAVRNLISTMVDMLSAGAAGSDLQPLMDVDNGETLLIDMTEAEIFSDRKQLSFEDKQIAGSFIGEMFSLITSDKDYSSDLMVEAKKTINKKMNQLHAVGDDLPSSISDIIENYTD